MPARIHILQRIIQAVGIPVIRLWTGQIRYYSIRADKPPCHWVIVPGVIVVKPGVVQPLAGKLPIGRYRAGAGGAKGEVLVPRLRILNPQDERSFRG